MSALRKYRRIARTHVAAVQFDLQMHGFAYEKWGGTQHCKPGDWLVNNRGDVYTIDADVFARTYSEVSLGVYLPTAPLWAKKATEAGVIATKEGATHYEAGDFLVFNDAQRKDGYAMSEERFRSLYESAD